MDLTRIGLGTNRLTTENVGFIREAVDAGIRMIDTAHVYTGGESERTLGEALPGGRDGMVIATKGGHADGRPESLRAQIEQSLRSLRTEAIDLYYLHRVDPDVPLEESLGTIAEYRDRGAIRDVGLSQVGVEQIERGRQVVPIAAVQNYYNLEHREHDDVLAHCEREGIAFVPFFPLREDGGKPVKPIAERLGVTEPQVILAWLLARSPATLPIPGTRSIEHVRENLAALEIELTEEDVAALQ